ncbi:hypothetical protein [Phyllobacterium endophyticum]|jgi:hypothetical protein|uniref:Uncharacterized protein n=1 Tax=Phyllobacterium endophyticum TaxID=1149773 RepID=A0A2P7B126_9HYPH|nr:hypothetical protein [Phyllobacterium endophyticum]MBB3237713.1 hypothetical protein [Phyllobacterium endophyticum]PSH60169.1 hypothetical protein CU100_05555 [Phyllobacterium endophyticum]TXR48624.1 hypothetical protein FVA77_13355 [Phyllobacterium endophyticum]TYR42336.1 hypothetical protein FY050_14120 [Phyllobacterium endophyticum]
MSIQKPMRPTDYPNRGFDCQLALDAEFRRSIDMLADEAAEAGWSTDETTRAIIGLALAYAADQRMDRSMVSAINIRRLFLN